MQSIRIEQAKRTLNQRIDELADAEGHQVSPELLDLLTDCLTVLQGVHYEDNDIVGILNDVLARLVGQPKFEFQLPPETVFEDYLSKIRHQ